MYESGVQLNCTIPLIPALVDGVHTVAEVD
jgi:hypothetical protein